MSLFKIPFLVSGALAAWLALTPPNPPPSPKEIVKKTGMERSFGGFVRIHALLWKVSPSRIDLVYPKTLTTSWQTSVLASISIDIQRALAQHNTSPFAERAGFGSMHDQTVHTYGPTLLFLVGWAALVLSGALRLWCYLTLGRMFTYEVTIREGHELVTRGPYAYVRHPSYAGVAFGVLGTLLLHFGPGSWFYDGGWFGTRSGLLYSVFWACMEAYVLISIMMRCPKEDELLMDQFRDEWKAWAEKVPYRICPGIF
ncbi:hypothetical protein EW146_g8772 [Bondarzewia mesenterica]|uniref:Protein-S-isoprenylcysteine O-methyltransferase n=1 Tax=Bondarzewia mesenterica TaxID=1095465 RepID=A0A4S4LBN9_9AGAM|nr:hypothetical protein EW146_g8772 [Bondarzewia mesenterica]